MQVNLVYGSAIATLRLTCGGWAQVPCLRGALQADWLARVSAAQVPDAVAAGQLCPWH